MIFLNLLYAQFLSADNLLLNPGFESWTSGTPDDWEYESGIHVFRESAIVHSGDFCLKDSLTTQSQSSADLISKTIKVTPGSICSLKVWVFDNDSAGRVSFAAFWNSGDSDYGYNISSSVDSNKWQQLKMEVNAPFTADSVKFAIRAYDTKPWDGDAIFYIDDAEFINTTAPIPPFVRRIWHKPTHPTQAEEATLYAVIADNGSIISDSLFYGVNSLDSPLVTSHSIINGDTFLYNIPSQSKGDTVFYYLWIKDDENLVTITDTNAYYTGNKEITINEVCYNTPGPDTACFVELYGPPGASLNGIEVVGINGSNGKENKNINLNGFLIPSDGFFVIAQDNRVADADTITPNANFENGPDNIELRFKGIRIDALGYGDGDFMFFGEGLPAPNISTANSLSRYPDGKDTDNNIKDFIETSSKTPGEPTPACIEESYIKQKPKLSFSPISSGSRKEFTIDIKQKGIIDFSIFNILGQRVFNLRKLFSNSGSQKITLNTTGLRPGVYFCKLKYKQMHLTEKFLIMK